MTEELFLPWYTQSVASDRARIARWGAAVNGTPAWAGSAFDGTLPTPAEIAAAARRDGVVWRRQTRMQMSLTTPAELFLDEKFLTPRTPAPERRRRRAAPAGWGGTRAPRPGGDGLGTGRPGRPAREPEGQRPGPERHTPWTGGLTPAYPPPALAAKAGATE